MRVIKHLLMFGILTAVAGSCFHAPEFPIEPRIEFEDMTYKRVNGIDSLIFFLTFTDGDGDLGLESSELNCSLSTDNNQICFENKLYTLYQRSEDGQYGIVDTGTPCNQATTCYNSKFLILKSDLNPVTYGDKRTNPEYAALPAFIKPYNCINWEVIRDSNGDVADTIYFQLNPNHHNFDIDFLVKNPNGTFTEFDFTKEFDYPNCGITYNGRFPILYQDRPGSPIEGKIRFGIGSPAFKAQFSLKTLKFRIQIKDRALNRSNIIETPEITF